jgi:arylsulfatase A-like enzyme
LRLSPQIPSLVFVLADAGRETAGFASVRFLRELSAGFETWDADVPTGRRPPYRYAEETLNAALRWLGERDPTRPFLLWVHLYDAHEHGSHARTAPRHLGDMTSDSTRYQQELLTFIRTRHGFPGPEWHGNFDRYDSQIALMDAQLARLHAAVEEATPGARTLWVVTADHGEGMGNHDHWSHGKHLYGEQLRVPLIFHASDGSLGPARIGKLVRLVDLLPTLAELTGAGLPQDAAIEGRSLLPLLLDTARAGWSALPAFAQRRPPDDRRRQDGWADGLVLAGQDERYKYILNTAEGDELYDLMADPLELDNLLEARPAVAKRLREGLARKYEALVADRRAGDDAAIDESHLEELEALGYLGGS